MGGEFWDSDAAQSFHPRAEELGLTDPDGRGRSVAVVDFDNDGRLDIVKSNKSRPLRLYRNIGREFVDVAAELNLAGPFGAHNPTTTSWADYDGDGDMDVVVTGKKVHLFRNDGTVFSDVTDKLPDKEICGAHAAAWGDYDNDGDPDLYLARSYGMMEGTASANLLLRNDGNGRFTDATDESGTGSWGNSRDATWFDFDNDGDLDLYVVNSASTAAFVPWFARSALPLWEPMLSDGVFDETNLLFQNHGDGTFTEVAEIAGVQGANSNSGVAVADVNCDGFLDLALSAGYYPLESGPILLYRNAGSANN